MSRKQCRCHGWATSKDQWVELYGKSKGAELFVLWMSSKAPPGTHHPACTKRRINADS